MGNYVRQPSGLFTPDNKIVYFDGTQPIFVLGGTNDTANTAALSTDMGGSFRGTSALKITGDEAADAGNTQAIVSEPFQGSVTQFRAYWKWRTLQASADLNYVNCCFNVYDGTNNRMFTLSARSNADGTQQTWVYDSTVNWVNISTQIPWATWLWSGEWNEVEMLVDLTAEEWTSIRVNDVTSLDPGSKAPYKSANTTRPYVRYGIDEEQTQTLTTVYLAHGFVEPLN